MYDSALFIDVMDDDNPFEHFIVFGFALQIPQQRQDLSSAAGHFDTRAIDFRLPGRRAIGAHRGRGSGLFVFDAHAFRIEAAILLGGPIAPSDSIVFGGDCQHVGHCLVGQRVEVHRILEH
jgi:hypothetical protein